MTKLRDILGLTESDINYEVAAEATPLYQATALSAMQDVLAGKSTPEEAWDVTADSLPGVAEALK